MSPITRRVFFAIFLGHILAILAIVIYAIVTVNKSILPEFSVEWIVSRAVVDWIDLFVPITLATVALAFSVFLSSSSIRANLQGERSFARITSGSIIVVIMVSAVFVGFNAFLYGPSRDSLESISNHSRDAKSYVQSALKLGEAKEYTKALDLVQRALILAPNYSEARQLRDNFASKKDKMKTPSPIEQSMATEASEAAMQKEVQITRNFGYADFIKKAEEYLAAKDWYSALYYINKASDSAGRIAPELAILKTRAERGIHGGNANEADAKKREIYEIKQAAILDKLQNKRPLDAYYLLLKAEALSKDDTDVRKWMPEVIKQLELMVFFTDELETATRRVSSGSIMFLNKQDGDNREYLHAASLVEGPHGFYLLEPELVVIDGMGKILEHRRADFGKIKDNVVLLKAVDRQSETAFHEAVVLAGKIPAAVRNSIQLQPKTDLLWDVATGHGGYESMPLHRQIAYLPVLRQLGYDAAPLQSVLLMELTKVVSLASLCFFAMAWAWSHRSRYLTLPIPLIILMLVLVPLFMILITSIYWVLCGALISGLLLTVGFEVGLVAIIAVQAAQLTVSLIFISGQSVD